MSSPLLTISVDLGTGARRLHCGSCAAEAVLDGDAGSPTRSASVTAFVAAHASCHRDRSGPSTDASVTDGAG